MPASSAPTASRFPHLAPRRNHNDSGQVLPIMALLLVLMLGMIGLAVDLGRVYVTKAQLSRSLDAAALAGAVELPNTTDATATQYMSINMPSATLSAATTFR